MGKEEFEKTCKKEGHKPALKIISYGVGTAINIKETEFTFICSICGATCTATGKWDNPTV